MHPSDQGPTTVLSFVALARWICVDELVDRSPVVSSGEVYRRTVIGTTGTKQA